MRVNNNNAVNTVATGTPTGAAQKVAQQGSQLTTAAAPGAKDDQASLSSASNLVSLAKNATTAARQAKLSALTAQVRSGSYQGDTGQAGKAMVKDLLQSQAYAAR